MDAEMKVYEAVKMLRQRLAPIYGEGEARAMVRLIFHHLKGWSQTEMIIHESDTISEYMQGKIDEILHLLEEHHPIQYILGEARFYGMDLHVAPGVLIPRPETEQLIDRTVSLASSRSDLSLMDVGTGSGAIAIALARNLRFPDITAVDVSPEALTIARENAKRLKADISFIQKDILSWAPEDDSLDFIVSNPPYIVPEEKAEMEEHVLGHEPSLALFVPASDPLLFYRRIADIGTRALHHGGWVVFEINPLFVNEMHDMLASLGYTDIDTERDFNSRPRITSARWP